MGMGRGLVGFEGTETRAGSAADCYDQDNRLRSKTRSIVRGVGSGLISINRMPRMRYCLC